MEIKRGIKDGRPFLEILDNPEISKAIHSKRITGAASTAESGIFEIVSKDTKYLFVYGYHERPFIIPNFNDENYRARLQKLVDKIRTWVNSINYKETFILI